MLQNVLVPEKIAKCLKHLSSLSTLHPARFNKISYNFINYRSIDSVTLRKNAKFPAFGRVIKEILNCMLKLKFFKLVGFRTPKQIGNSKMLTFH